LWQILQSTARAFPRAAAIDDGKSVLDYAGLLHWVQQVGDWLSSVGIGAGDRVGIRVSSGAAELYVSILAVLSVGAAYVPVDAYPAGGPTGENCLIATKAMVPLDGPVRADAGLLGSPCFEIPRSATSDDRFDHFRTGRGFGSLRWQCHSMEDGIFKADSTVLEDDCTLGAGAFVHYGVTVGQGAYLRPDSFLMKGGRSHPAAAGAGTQPAPCDLHL
jgi:hypothetical protein